MKLDKALETGLIRFQQIDPAEMSPGEFAANVRHSVEAEGARLVVIDSLNGYLNAMPEGRFLVLQMHELLSYLNQQGVLSLLVLAQHGLVGPMNTPLDMSYLSDAVLMLRVGAGGGGEVTEIHRQNIATAGRKASVSADGVFVGLMEELIHLDVRVMAEPVGSAAL